MQQNHPGINPSISEWRGQEIVDFQEDLLGKVNAQISEKWFYTHMKSEHRSLPRIDVLNFLSKYAGYENWDDFKFKNSNLLQRKVVAKNPNRYFIIIPVLLIVILGIFYLLFRLISTREYQFCFYDADTRESITNCAIDVTLLMDDESPVHYLCQPGECFTVKTNTRKIKMVVGAPYYRTDTISRILKRFNRNETIKLHANDYVLMIHYFSTMSVEDWKKRRSSLDEMIDDGAMIYQVHNNKKTAGMQLYDKWEFIDKLTMPSGNLKNIEILDTKLIDDKISILRFTINDQP